ncbi:MAG: hypothetical protein RR450_09760, partial [Oscillospiraceae bacterium]
QKSPKSFDLELSIGRSEIMGLGKSQSYQWFVGSRQAVFLQKTELVSTTPPKGDYGRRLL